MSRYVEACRCGNAPDYICESTKVGEKRMGPDGVTIQPYVKFFRCRACLKADVTGIQRPRKVEALPHEATRIRREKREAQDALLGKVEEQRLGDWGKQPVEKATLREAAEVGNGQFGRQLQPQSDEDR